MIPRTNASGMASMKQPTQIMMAASRSDSLLVAWRSSGRGGASFLGVGVSCHGGDSGISAAPSGATMSRHSPPPPAAASAASAAGAGAGVAGVASSRVERRSEKVRSPAWPPATSALASAPPSAPSPAAPSATASPSSSFCILRSAPSSPATPSSSGEASADGSGGACSTSTMRVRCLLTKPFSLSTAFTTKPFSLSTASTTAFSFSGTG
mmetsp:Transcript_37500/g.123717  ORF Transcript_37500/g.123717 Transcript_37500/m.123717 type:complete len:210 (+) Transcript_37500:1065-1694(+)